MPSDENYAASFHALTGYPPFDYQLEVARLLFDGRNVVLRAPTGAGKTWAVLAPFFSDDWRARPARLIYALPLRTLANGIYREAQTAAGRPRPGSFSVISPIVVSSKFST